MKINNFFQNYGMQEPRVPVAQNTMEKSTSAFSGDGAKALDALFSKYNQKPDSDVVKTVENFMDKVPGSVEEKLETVEMALYKNIEITPDHLEAIHASLGDNGEILEALMGPSVETPEKKLQTLLTLSDYLKLPEDMKQAIRAALEVFSSPEGSPAQAFDVLISALGIRDAGEFLTALGFEPTLVQESFSAENFLAVMQALLSEDGAVLVNDLKIDGAIEAQVLDLHGEQIEQTHDRPEKKVDFETFKSNTDTAAVDVEDDADETVKISEPSAEGSEKLQKKTLDAPEMEDLDLEEQVLSALAQLSSMMGNTMESLEASIDFKQYLIETTTEATIQAKADFTAFQKSVETLLTFDVETDVDEALSKTIEKLDRLILRSNVGLFTDMYQEKALLQSRTQLDEARAALDSGDFDLAMERVETVKTAIGEIVFKPSETRIQLFASIKKNEASAALLPETADKNPLDIEIKKMLEWYKDASGMRQSRDVMEMIRFMGGNHEAEVVESLEARDVQKHQEWMQGNVKEILLRLMKEDTENRSVEAQTMSLTGQQMMNQQDQQNRRQFHFFNLPFEDGETVGSMKVYLQGSRSGSKLDYKNTEMYFGMHLNRLGETGIKVKITGGTCDVTVMNANPEALRATFESVFSELADFGVVPGMLRFETTVNRVAIGGGSAAQTQPENDAFVYDPKKGFDYSI